MMTRTTTVERVGARCYAVGAPFGAKDRLKALGCHWDGDRRQWWIGAAKVASLTALVAEINGETLPAVAATVGLDPATPTAVVADKLREDLGDAGAAAVLTPKEDVDACRVYAKLTYKGRTYYVIAETRDQTRCRLTTLDGLAPFWADCSECELVRRYEGRERWDGRRYSGKTVTVYDTIGSLREYRDSQAKAKTAGHPACAACGKRGHLVHDLEDGLSKCRGCCDMPAD